MSLETEALLDQVRRARERREETMDKGRTDTAQMPPVEVYILPLSEASACQVQHPSTRMTADHRGLVYDHDEVVLLDVHGNGYTTGIRLCRSHALMLSAALRKALDED